MEIMVALFNLRTILLTLIANINLVSYGALNVCIFYFLYTVSPPLFAEVTFLPLPRIPKILELLMLF